MALFQKRTERKIRQQQTYTNSTESAHDDETRPSQMPNMQQAVPPPPPVSPSASSAATPESGLETVQASSAYTPPPEFKHVRAEVQQFLVEQVKSISEVGGPAKLRQLIEPVFNRSLESVHLLVSRAERGRMLDLILADILGYGPIQPLLDRDDITEVMINGHDQVFIEQSGKLLKTDVKFIDDTHLLQVIERIVSPLGRRIDESSPTVDARLPDGSRVNAVIPPLSLIGPCVTIRKFRKDPFTAEDMIRFGTISPEVAEFVKACVTARLNIIVSGGTGSGKTTMLNMVSSYIPTGERILTIEDAAELRLQQPHVVSLEKRPPNIEGKGEISIRDLVVNSLRMRPDRIIVGEIRSGEALDMLQAMNTGHDGSLTTVHSNGARDTLSRIETLVLMAGMDLPLRAIRQQVASAVNLIIHLDRLRDGSRRVVQVSEVVGMEGETIVMQDIFMFKQEGISEDGRIIGSLQPTGLRPRCNDALLHAGISLPPSTFGIDADSLWKDDKCFTYGT